MRQREQSLAIADAEWSPGRAHVREITPAPTVSPAAEPVNPLDELPTMRRFATWPPSGDVENEHCRVTFGTRGIYCNRCMVAEILPPECDAAQAAIEHALQHARGELAR